MTSPIQEIACRLSTTAAPSSQDLVFFKKMDSLLRQAAMALEEAEGYMNAIKDPKLRDAAKSRLADFDGESHFHHTSL